MSSSKFVGQLKQNNVQINNLKELNIKTEKHMVVHEEKLSEMVNDFIEYQNYKLKTHTENIDNPHQVTKKQVGLGNVLDVEQAAKVDFDNHTKDNVHHISTVERETWNSKETITGSQAKADKALDDAKEYTDDHISDTVKHITDNERSLWNSAETNAKAYTDIHANRNDNPHSVTKSQIGLGNVSNVQQAAKIDFDDHVGNSTIHTTLEEKASWDAKETPSGAQAKADKALDDSKKLLTDYTWITATMQNNWSHYNDGIDVRFGIDATNTVFIRGSAKGGNVGTTVFTLPTGFRPTRDMGYLQIASGTAQVARLLIKTTGEVIVESVSSNTSYIKFDFSFKTV
ncbi:hypothetical protein J9345_11280 [Bacillus subtilis subsp. subtilis]|uniref:hypothetical protein n=1 Tax=Bacillus subtilis TaxID=1423 RepID=UPI000EF27CB9|nr:hypothetical protein [Bacillus subtilis]AYK67737.1 hypothetical protein D9C11_21360 [Bacillus subtilis subsp. subtilis]MBP3047250.1 hypothetical protein [Bacillus subtilis subsp. subtilis]CAF1853893.1 hypothetical protein NRS6141_04177 [Bacillus subtilis]CAF1897750.1 hypothetical protein NRS6204_02125 [Bacillus subtilis]CAF1916399.1 hypothetical protein NRS6205_03901 [Bacillus subtilis]